MFVVSVYVVYVSVYVCWRCECMFVVYVRMFVVCVSVYVCCVCLLCM